MLKVHKISRLVNKSGFTLIELIVVIAIIGILIAAAVAGITIAQRAGRDNVRERDMTSIKAALESCYGSVGAGSSPAYAASSASVVPLLGQVITIKGTCNSTVTIQQATVSLSYNATGCNQTTPASATVTPYNSNTNTWTVNYNQLAGGGAYQLCTKLENGSYYDLSS